MVTLILALSLLTPPDTICITRAKALECVQCFENAKLLESIIVAQDSSIRDLKAIRAELLQSIAIKDAVINDQRNTIAGMEKAVRVEKVKRVVWQVISGALGATVIYLGVKK